MNMLRKFFAHASRVAWALTVLLYNAATAEEQAAMETPAPTAVTAPAASATSATSATPASPAPAPIPAILQPYTVQVWACFSADALFSSQRQESLLAAVRQDVSRRFRQMWDVSVEAPLDHRRFESTAISRLAVADVRDQLLSQGGDKIFLCGVERLGANYVVTTREWDSSSRTLSPTITTQTTDPRDLSSVVVDGLAAAFRPLAVSEVLDPAQVDFQIRAGEFLPTDDSVLQLQPGDFLVPFMRYLDRKGEVRQVQMFAWTYFKVESVERSRARLQFISSFRFPFSGSSKRNQVMAMRVRPEFPTTELKIFPRRNPLNPLVGYRCEVLGRLPSEGDTVDDRLKLTTDRRGIVTIPTDFDSPQKYVTIYSGDALLARVPLVTGIDRSLELEVPDDRARLNVEGEVSLLQQELIDLVATREVIMARARGAATKMDWQKFDEFMKELEALPTQQSFITRIDTLQLQAVYRAQQLKDKVQESRVKKLCFDISESAKKYLDPARVIDFRQEMRDLRGE